jgi:hypothetical protein
MTNTDIIRITNTNTIVLDMLDMLDMDELVHEVWLRPYASCLAEQPTPVRRPRNTWLANWQAEFR